LKLKLRSITDYREYTILTKFLSSLATVDSIQ